ncbi:hypothetical protein [Methylomonas fluvii]|nr:hypothetical protein [Methylomonas fluvii]
MGAEQLDSEMRAICPSLQGEFRLTEGGCLLKLRSSRSA